MILLFMSFLFAGLAQFLIPNSTAKKGLSIGLFILQISTILSLFASTPKQVLHVGAWPHFAGITWYADTLSISFSCLVVLLFLPAYLSSLSKLSNFQQALLHFFAAGLVGAFFTSDLLNLFVMFEIVVISSFTFFAQSNALFRSKLFVWASVIGSAFYLVAIALIYKSFGTVSMADLGVYLTSNSGPQVELLFWIMGFVFLLKAGLWPLCFWMPSSYPSLPASSLAFFGVLSSKLGVYAFARWTILSGWQPLENSAFVFEVFCILGLLFLCAGAFAAKDLRKSLAYWTMSHTCLSLLFLCILSAQAFEGFLMYVFQDVIVMAGLFYFCSEFEKAGSPKQIFNRQPILSLVFLLLCLSASGFPLTSGFWPKIILLQAASSIQLIFFMTLLSAILFLGLSIHYWNRYFVGPQKELCSERKISASPSMALCAGFAITCIFVFTRFHEKIRMESQASFSTNEYVERILESSSDVKRFSGMDSAQ